MKYRNLKIAISSGKGGTGKTFVATNIAFVLRKVYQDVSYLDCDVEEPNGHLFIKPDFRIKEDINILSPVKMDPEKCTLCGKCADACTYNAIVVAGKNVMLFKELCHVCGACSVVCPEDAVIEEERKIGVLRKGSGKGIKCVDALLDAGEGGMSPRLIQRVKKECCGEGINIMDSPPGTACPVVETVKDVDLCVLVTDPTPFGINDLKLSVDMARKIGQEPVIIVNRADYKDNKLKKYCEEEDLEIIGEIPDKRKIAEMYSEGDIVVEKTEEYNLLFKEIARKILDRADKKKKVLEKTVELKSFKDVDIEKAKASMGRGEAAQVKELVVISGKGGTGKTSITACFAALSSNSVISDCDVDAADLHLVLIPEIREKGYFSGGVEANIDLQKCTGCGECKRYCRFSAVKEKNIDGVIKYEIDSVACEGCGVCGIVCNFDAVKVKDAVNGEWYISDTRYGPMSHAKLGIAEENSGRLVTLVKDKGRVIAGEIKTEDAVIDGAPGTGCPVISSLTGARYAIIVTEPTVSGIHDMKRILDVTRHFGIEAGVIINKFDLNNKNTDKVINICNEEGVEVLGKILYDTVITDAQMNELPVVEYAPETEVSKDIIQIYKQIKAKLNIS